MRCSIPEGRSAAGSMPLSAEVPSALICPYALVCQMRNGLLSERNLPGAYRPFDASASGYVPGEGGAILIAERLEFAQQRSAPKIYGEIVGYGATQDAYHFAKPAPDGEQLARAMRMALQEAGVGPADIDVIFADAVGDMEWDRIEAKAIREVFGSHSSEVPVTAPKSMVGRLHSASAALDVATALLAMRDSCIPPTINLDRPAKGCELNFVQGKALPKDLNHVLVNARGFGGFNSSLVIRKHTP